jgi:hypothetical protein
MTLFCKITNKNKVQSFPPFSFPFLWEFNCIYFLAYLVTWCTITIIYACLPWGSIIIPLCPQDGHFMTTVNLYLHAQERRNIM